MESVLDAPIGAYRMQDARGLGREGSGHVPSIRLKLFANAPLRFDVRHGGQTRPAFPQAHDVKPVQLVHGLAATHLQTPMPVVQHLEDAGGPM